MRYNVAQLLREPIGATRRRSIGGELALAAEGVQAVGPLTGAVRLLRTDAGVFVKGSAQIAVMVECSRCLRPLMLVLKIDLEEEFRASGPFATDHRDSQEAEDPALLISDQHELDLQEVLRQQLLLAVPMRPACRPDCAGLCPHCGQNLNDGPCECSEEPDPRWSALQALRLSGDFEEGVD